MCFQSMKNEYKKNPIFSGFLDGDSSGVFRAEKNKPYYLGTVGLCCD